MRLKLFLITFFIFFFIAFVSLVLSLTKEIVLNINNKIDFTIKNLQPKIKEKRVFEIDLTGNKIYFFEDGRIKRIIPIAYQAPYGKWYQTPTGYFRAGVKHQKHISSLFPVYMNYAVQMYEDFFIHEIPYYLDGKQVTSEFTGGCIRLENSYAKEFFDLIQPGDLIISYLTFENFKIKNGFHQPVNIKEFFIRQRFNSPLRVLYTYSKNRETDYIQHSGIDIAPLPSAKDLNVYSVTDGKVVKIVKNGEGDHGLGNTVIMEINSGKFAARLARCASLASADASAQTFSHCLPESRSPGPRTSVGTSLEEKADNNSQLDEKLYILYGHMAEINPEIKEGDFVKAGQILGKVGATGYGCNYWRIGEDGCDKKSALDVHLHLEIKTKPVLESPEEAVCYINGKTTKCYGYVPHNPQNYGYLDPLMFLFEKTR